MLRISAAGTTVFGGGASLMLMVGCFALLSSSEDSTASEAPADAVTETITETSARSRTSAAQAGITAQQEVEREPTISRAQRCDMKNYAQTWSG